MKILLYGNRINRVYLIEGDSGKKLMSHYMYTRIPFEYRIFFVEDNGIISVTPIPGFSLSVERV